MASSADITKIAFADGDKLLGASNYMVWAFLLENILREKELWELVQPDILQPQPSTSSGTTAAPSTSSGTTATSSSTAPTTAAATSTTTIGQSTSSATTTTQSSFTQKDKDRVIIIICKTVSSTIIPTVMRLRAAPDQLWISLKKRYKPAALQRRLDLKKALLDFKMNEGSSVQDSTCHRTTRC